MRDEPIEYGVHCTHCFANGETPKYVYVRFIGIEKCTGVGKGACLTPPNDRAFKLKQLVGFPCSWQFSDSVWTIDYQAWVVADGKAHLQLIDFNNAIYFERTLDSCQPEGTVWSNSIACAPGLPCGESGIAVVTWSPQATALLEAINLSKGEDLFMELFPLENGKLVYKFCRIQDATNIKFLFEP